MQHLTPRRGVAALAAVLLSGCALVQPPPGRSGSDHASLGVFPGGSGSHQTELTQLEQQLGHKVGLVRVFLHWDSSFPNSYTNWLKQTGHDILVSVQAGPSWSSVASGSQDSALRSWAQRVRSYGAPVWFTYSHEPEAADHTGHGNATQFKAAWRRLVSVFRQEGVTNARFTPIFTAWGFKARTSDPRHVSNWYPGDDVVDAIGADGYNWYGCRHADGWLSFATIFSGLRDWAAAHPSKEVVVGEFGSAEDPQRSGRKAQWLTDTRNLLKTSAWSQFKAVAYFNSAPRCPWWLDSSSSSLNAFGAWAADPYYQ